MKTSLNKEDLLKLLSTFFPNGFSADNRIDMKKILDPEYDKNLESEEFVDRPFLGFLFYGPENRYRCPLYFLLERGLKDWTVKTVSFIFLGYKEIDDPEDFGDALMYIEGVMNTMFPGMKHIPKPHNEYLDNEFTYDESRWSERS